MAKKEQIVLNEYPNHHYRHRFHKTDMNCPFCKNQTVWDGHFECYVQCECTEHVCTHCKTWFYLTEGKKSEDNRGLRMIEQLILKTEFKPITPRGN